MVPDPSTMFELTRHGQTFGYIETPNMPNNIDMTSYVGGTNGLMSGNSNGALVIPLVNQPLMLVLSVLNQLGAESPAMAYSHLPHLSIQLEYLQEMLRIVAIF